MPTTKVNGVGLQRLSINSLRQLLTRDDSDDSGPIGLVQTRLDKVVQKVQIHLFRTTASLPKYARQKKNESLA